MSFAVLGTSFLAHALVSTQRTVEASKALDELVAGPDMPIVPNLIVVEFGSLLRKGVTQARIGKETARRVFQEVLDFDSVLDPSWDTLVRGFELATRLDQSDTFDSTGYAMAEAPDGEFWTSDRRFANAAESAALGRVRFFP